MGWLRALRRRRREKANLLAALAATQDDLAECQRRRAATWTEFVAAKDAGGRRNQILREQDATLRRQRADLDEQRTEIEALRRQICALVLPTGTPCSKLAWHTRGEAIVFGEWLDATTGCGAMAPYPCRQCRPHVVTGQPVWHATHADIALRGLGDATHTTLAARLPAAKLREFQRRFLDESNTGVADRPY